MKVYSGFFSHRSFCQNCSSASRQLADRSRVVLKPGEAQQLLVGVVDVLAALHLICGLLNGRDEVCPFRALPNGPG